MRKLRPLWTRWGRARRRSPQTAKWNWTRRRRRERSKWGRVRGRRRQRTRRRWVRRQPARPRRPPQQCARGQRLRPLRQLRRSHFRVAPSLSALKCHGGQVRRRRGGQLRCRPHQAGQIPPNFHHQAALPRTCPPARRGDPFSFISMGWTPAAVWRRAPLPPGRSWREGRLPRRPTGSRRWVSRRKQGSRPTGSHPLRAGREPHRTQRR